MGQLSTRQAADRANRMLEADDSLLDEKSQAAFLEIFRGGGRVNGKYVPLSHDQLEEAMRLPENED